MPRTPEITHDVTMQTFREQVLLALWLLAEVNHQSAAHTDPYLSQDTWQQVHSQTKNTVGEAAFSASTCRHMHLYRVSRGECARLRENVPYVKVHRSNPKHLYPKLNGYGDNSERKVWSSCGSTYCTCCACCYPYTAHVRPSVSQPSQAHSAFIINRCHSYSEL